MSISCDEAVLLLTQFEGETFGHTLTNLLKEVKRLREENERLHGAIRGCDSMKCTWLHEEAYKEMTTPKEMIE